MNPARRRRLLWVLLFAAAAAIAVGLLVLALQRNLSYLYTPSEVLDGQAGAAVASGRARFRLGGMVEKGSFQRAAGSLQSRFAVTDGDAHLPVSYDRMLPDLFGEGQAVVASGRMQAGSFVAEQVLAKHDETYMPREVADKMQSAHRRHAVPAAADTATGAGIAVARAR